MGNYDNYSNPDNLNSAENLNEKQHLHFEFGTAFELVMLVNIVTLRSQWADYAFTLHACTHTAKRIREVAGKKFIYFMETFANFCLLHSVINGSRSSFQRAHGNFFFETSLVYLMSKFHIQYPAVCRDEHSPCELSNAQKRYSKNMNAM